MAGKKRRYQRYKRKRDIEWRGKERKRERGTEVPLHVLAKLDDAAAEAYVIRQRRRNVQP